MPTDANFSVTSPVLNPGESFLVKYRLQPAVPFTTLSPNPTTNDFTIPNLEDGCYDFTIQKVKSDGTVCPNTRSGTFCIGEGACCTPDITGAVSIPFEEDVYQFQISYNPASCTPPPDSIRLYYREKGSVGAYSMSDGHISSPINQLAPYPEMEGYIVGMCGDTESAIQVPFETTCVAPEIALQEIIDDDKIKITLAQVGNYEVKVFIAGDVNCAGGSPVYSGTITADDEITTPSLPDNSYVVCVRRICSESESSDYTLSDSIVIDTGGGGTPIPGVVSIDACADGYSIQSVRADGVNLVGAFPVSPGSFTPTSYPAGSYAIRVTILSLEGAVAACLSVTDSNGVSQYIPITEGGIYDFPDVAEFNSTNGFTVALICGSCP